MNVRNPYISINNSLRVVLAFTSMGVALVGCSGSALAQSYSTWNGSTSAAWSLPANWSSGVPTDVAQFSTTPPPANQPSLGTTAETANALQFTAAGYTVSGSGTGSLTLNGTDTLRSIADVAIDASALTSGTDTISAPVSISATPTTSYILVGSGGNLVFSGVLKSLGTNLDFGTLNGSYTGTVTLSGSSSNGAANQFVANSGTLLLDKTGTAASIGKNLTVNGGLVQVVTGAGSSQFGRTAGLTLDTGTFDLNGVSQTLGTIGGITSGNTAVLTNSSSTQATLTVNSNATVYNTITGNLSISADNTYSAGTNDILFYSTGNTYTGATIATGQNVTGTLTASYINAEKANVLSPNSAVQLNNVVAGTSTYALILNGNNEIGSLSGDTSGYTGFNNVNLNSYTLMTGNDNTNTTYGGVISGTGAVTKIGTGSFTLTGANAYTALTTVENGALIAGANAPSGSAGAFGNATSAIALGDATTLSNGYSPSLLIGKNGVTVARSIVVGSSTGGTPGTYTIGYTGTSGSGTFTGQILLNQQLTLQSATGGTLAISGVISDGGHGYQVTTAGSGTASLSGASTYTGGTVVSSGSHLSVVNGSSGSGTGYGSVAVNGTLSGNGTIAPTTGTGVTVNGGGSLRSGVTGATSTGAGTGIALNNAANLSKILTVSGTTSAPANLTFALGADTTSSGQPDNFNPAKISTNSTYMTVTGTPGTNNGEISFSGTDSITFQDLTANGTSPGTLTLRMGTPYLLIQAGGGTSASDDMLYSGLVTESGTGGSTVYSLDGNGYVVGVAANGYTGGSTISSTDYTAIGINEVDINGNPLTGAAYYPAPILYLDDGDLEVVPEPSTWAMMIGGLAVLMFWQQRRKGQS